MNPETEIEMAAAKTAARTTKSATEAFESVTSASTEAVRENIDRGLAAMSEAQSFGKQNVEAFLASASAAQKGIETLSARTVAYQKQAIENHVAAAKSLMTSKSVQEFVEKQNDYAKSTFEAYVAELTSLSELMSGLTKDAFKPLNERVNAVGHLIQTGAQR
jgi:phasin family protein